MGQDLNGSSITIVWPLWITADVNRKADEPVRDSTPSQYDGHVIKLNESMEPQS